LHKGQVVAIMGANGLGKSTFLNIISGRIKPDKNNFKFTNTTYKEQDLESSELKVKEYLENKGKNIFSDRWLKSMLIDKLDLERVYEEKVSLLSGGELQKVNIVGALAKEAELILMDEPSAFIDVEDRLKVAEIIKDFAIKKEVCAIIVDHDIQFVDYLADSILVFEGISGKHGEVFGPFEKAKGMNRVLKNLNITYRKDNETNRARINKEGSQLDQMQKSKGEYY
jgi:ATP-binding cassette subfamily E protein 1